MTQCKWNIQFGVEIKVDFVHKVGTQNDVRTENETETNKMIKYSVVYSGTVGTKFCHVIFFHFRPLE